MTQKIGLAKQLTRRDFLKFGCLSGAGAGLAVCGVGVAVTAPDPLPDDLPSYSFGENMMSAKMVSGRILIAYASNTGSTAEVAAEIGKMMGARGFGVDVRPVGENPAVDGYQAVVVGSAVNYGKWLPEAVDFVKRNQQALSGRPVALFCVHIRNLEEDEASLQARRAYLDEVRPLVQAVDEAYFAGRFDRRGAALLMPGLLARFIPNMDRRNWKKIRGWGEDVTASLGV